MKKRVYGKLFVMLLALSMLFLTFASAGASVRAATDETDDVSVITIHISPEYSDGCDIRVCKVGEYINGSYVLDSEYADCGSVMKNLSEASASQAAAEKLSAVASKSTDGKTESFNSDGYASFKLSSTVSSVYVAFQTSGFENAKISPSLFVIPYTNESGELVRNISIDAKYEPVPKVEKGSVILNKYGLMKKPLKDAVFDLERIIESETGSEVSFETVVAGLITDKNGQIVVTDLPFGKYRFVEKMAPEGYMLNPESKEFVISSSGTVKLSEGIYAVESGDVVIYDVIDEPIEISTEPESSIEVSEPKPSDPVIITGEDIAKFIIIGVVVGVSLVAVILLVILGRKKKDNDDDEE